MTLRTWPSLLIAAALAACTSHSEPTAQPSPYAGEQTRPIKTLSERDVDELRSGGGWGLAKAAELNGVPGPKHVLELAEQLDLTPQQRDAVERVFQDMSTQAKTLGAQFVTAERELSDAFAAEPVDRAHVQQLVQASAGARAQLQLAHLAAHIDTAALLTPQQRERYVQLRGYGSEDPCTRVPSGHDPAMWRRHHACERERQ